jgi:Tfp pilus assembly protein PilF
MRQPAPPADRCRKCGVRFSGARYNFGTALSSMGQMTRAMEQYRQALRFRPEYAPAHNNLGHGLLAMAKPDEAAHHFREAVRLDRPMPVHTTTSA